MKIKEIKNKKSFWVLLISVLILTIPLIDKTFQNDTYFTIPTGNYILENGINDVEPFTWHEDLKFTKLRWGFDIIVAGIYNVFRINWIIYFYSGNCRVNSTELYL